MLLVQDDFQEPERIMICAVIERMARRAGGPAKVNVLTKAGPFNVLSPVSSLIATCCHMFSLFQQAVFFLQLKWIGKMSLLLTWKQGFRMSSGLTPMQGRCANLKYMAFDAKASTTFSWRICRRLQDKGMSCSLPALLRIGWQLARSKAYVCHSYHSGLAAVTVHVRSALDSDSRCLHCVQIV